MGKLLRRTFLIGSAAIAGGVAIGYWQVKKPYPNPLLDGLGNNDVALTPYVLIKKDGVSIIAPRGEMGQGVRTTLAALVAEELDVELGDVNVIHGPAAKAYYNGALYEEAAPFPITDNGIMAETVRGMTHVVSKLMALQVTGGSSAIPDAFDKMRKAGAAARIVLIAAAAKKLNLDARQLSTGNGAVISPDGTLIPYSDLCDLARNIDPPDNPPLKPQSQWRILGKTQNKVDMVDKCTGQAQYAIDIRQPGMLFATVRASPHLGSGIISVNTAAAQAMPGVRKVIRLDTGVAVIATNTWSAMRAADALEIDWEEATYPASTDEIRKSLIAAFDTEPDSQERKDGDVAAIFSDTGSIAAEYFVPYLAHATMEPMTGAALLKEGHLDLWVGTQAPLRCREVASALTGLSETDIDIHTTYLGGGFGRRGETDFVSQIVQIAQAMEGTPISMAWTREEDMTHDVYRPMAMARFEGSYKDGIAHAFDLHLASSPTALNALARQGKDLSIADPTIVQNAWDNPYTIENYRVTGYKAPVALPIGFWRSVGASQNGFFQESAMDELAYAAGQDPIDFRLKALEHPPSRNVLEKVREMSGWTTATPDGHGRGVAFYLSFGVPVAEVIEVAMTPAGIKLIGIWAAADVGTALDPGNIQAQVQSGIIYGLTAAMMGEITVEDSKVVQTNFHNYKMLRMHQSPPIEVAILENGEKIRGIGEPGTPPAAPALANAIYAATGQRIRELPLKNSIKFI